MSEVVVEDFPRGSAYVLTPLEARKIRDTAEKDVLFGNYEPERKKKKVSSKSKKIADKESSSLKTKNIGVTQFSFKYLVKGLLVLGYVKEINKTEVIVGLPNSLNGYLSLSDLQSLLLQLNEQADSDIDSGDEQQSKECIPASKLFDIGQLIPVAIKDLIPEKHGYKKIALTVFASDVNKAFTKNSAKVNMLIWGMVTSVEDHGLLVSFGKEDVSGFLPKSDTTDKLKVGSFSWFCVRKITNRKVLTLTIDSKKLVTSQVTDATSNFNSLLPGQLVKLNVLEATEEAATGKIFDSFDAIVANMHIPIEGKNSENLARRKVKARIIHINPQTKQLGLSLLPSVLEFPENILTPLLNIGDVVEDCEVVKCEVNGLFLKMPNGESGFVHISRVSDGHIEGIGKKFKVGSKHKSRILGYSALDSIYSLSLKASELNKLYFRHHDLKPGMMVSGIIITLEDFGCLVKVDDHIQALCPKMHLADIALKHPERKFVEGKEMKCRVLNVNPDAKKLILTHKKTLVNSMLPIITSFDNENVGKLVHGFVSDIKPFGLFVKFYNNVSALLPISNISLPQESTLNELYYVGQVLQCTVVFVNPDKKRMIVSLKSTEHIGMVNKQIKKGDVINASFQKYVNTGVLLKDVNENKVHLSVQYISDFNYLNDEWNAVLKSMSKDFKFEQLLVTGFDKKEEHYTVSQKIVQQDREIKTFDDLKVDMIYVGVVCHLTSFGLFVELAPGVNGLAPKSQLSDQFVAEVSDFFKVGQSVIAKVTEIDKDKHRFLVCLKPSVLLVESDHTLNAQFTDANLTNVYLQQRTKLYSAAETSNDDEIRLLPSYIGEVLITKVESVNHDGVVLQYHDETHNVDINGFVPKSLKHGADLEVGQDCQCYVVYADLSDQNFIATTNEEAIKKTIKRKQKQEAIKFPAGERLEAVITYITQDIVVLTLPAYGHVITYMSRKKHLNDICTTTCNFTVNQKISVKYERTSEGSVVVKSLSDVSVSPKDLTVGSVINVVIKGVKPTQLSVTLCNGKVHGRIHVSNILDEIAEGVSPLDQFKPLQTVKTKIIGFRDLKTHNFLPISHMNISKSLVELSVKPSDISSSDHSDLLTKQTINEFSKGERVTCFITSMTKSMVWVRVNASIKGKIALTRMSKNIRDLKKARMKFMAGNAYHATVVDIDKEHECLELSRIDAPNELVKKGNSVIGRIIKILTNAGLLIELPNLQAGITNVTEISDEFEENPLQSFAVNQFVWCKVLAVIKQNQINLSLRPSRLADYSIKVTDRIIDGYDDIKAGDILRGYVKTVSKMGVFVYLSASITGRVQIKNLSQFFVKDFVSLIPVGKLVKAKILSIDPNNNNIDLSLRGKDVDGPDLAPAPKRKTEDQEDEASPTKTRKIEKLIISSGHNKVESDEESEETESESDEEMDEEEDENNKTVAVSTEDKPSLKLSTAFDWADDEIEEMKNLSDDSDDSADEENQKTLVKMTKRQKRAAKKSEEEQLHKAELALLDTERQIESAEDFDRLVLGSPNSSLMWIQYMAFHLHSAEIEKARIVANRALKTISFREEQEKLNVWVALLNLESLYGTTEILDKTFQEAVKVNEPKKIYMKMVDIYVKNNKTEEAEKMYQVMLKRFKGSKKVWTNYAVFLMKTGRTDAARILLQRSLKSLPERKHIETIVKFAMMEYKIGEPQRGSTIFESLLKNYPKRTDLWSVYIDMTIKEGDLEQVRNIFERTTVLNMSSKKMKFLFKRYLEFEEQYGSKTTVEAVRKKALEYVEERMMNENEICSTESGYKIPGEL